MKNNILLLWRCPFQQFSYMAHAISVHTAIEYRSESDSKHCFYFILASQNCIFAINIYWAVILEYSLIFSVRHLEKNLIIYSNFLNSFNNKKSRWKLKLFLSCKYTTQQLHRPRTCVNSFFLFLYFLLWFHSKYSTVHTAASVGGGEGMELKFVCCVYNVYSRELVLLYMVIIQGWRA